MLDSRQFSVKSTGFDWTTGYGGEQITAVNMGSSHLCYSQVLPFQQASGVVGPLNRVDQHHAMSMTDAQGNTCSCNVNNVSTKYITVSCYLVTYITYKLDAY